MAAENGNNLARIPPPPPQPFKPSPPPPSPSPDGHSAIIVIVFISLGSCLFFFAFVAAAICCFIKKKKEKSKHQEVAEVIHMDGHRKVHEAVASGAHGQQAVMLTIDDDVHIDEIVKKKEHKAGHGLHGKHDGANYSSTMEVPLSSSNSTSDSNVTHHQS